MRTFNHVGIVTTEQKENAFFKMEMLVLLVLKKQDCYGYEIANYMKEQTDGIIDMNLGTLYPVLYRLVNASHS